MVSFMQDASHYSKPLYLRFQGLGGGDQGAKDRGQKLEVRGQRSE